MCQGDEHKQAALLEETSLKGCEVLFKCGAEFLSYKFRVEYKP